MSEGARPRAPNHDARPRKLPSGTWTVQVMLGGRRYSASGPTAADARGARDDLKRRWRRGELSPPPTPGDQDAQNRTTGAFLRVWLMGRQRSGIEPVTWRRHAVEVEKRLVPALGAVPLDRLTRAQVRSALDSFRQAGSSSRTVRFAREALRLACQQAVDDGLLRENPAAGIRLPRERKAPARALGPADVRSLLTIDDRWRPLWLTALCTGMRLGELLGLPWSAVDWDGCAIQVCQVLAIGADGQYHLRDYPKRQASIRRIDVPSELLATLRVVEQGQTDAQRTLGLVFSARNGTPWRQSNVVRAFKLACGAAGVVLRRREGLHLLRHTYASTLLAAGRPIPEVAYLLGHSPATLMAIYAHFLPAPTTRAADALREAYTLTEVKPRQSTPLWAPTPNGDS